MFRDLVFRRRKKDPYKETIYALYNAKQALGKIELLMDRISNRRRRMLEMTAELEMRGQKYLAKRYAQEIVKLDKIYTRLSNLHLVLEKIAVSLEYALTIRNFKGIAHEVLSITSEIKRLPESTIPDISLSLTNLEYALRSLEDMDLSMIDMMAYEPGSSSEVEKILEEAREILGKKLMADIDLEPSGVKNSV